MTESLYSQLNISTSSISVYERYFWECLQAVDGIIKKRALFYCSFNALFLFEIAKRWQRLEGFHSQHHFFRAQVIVWNDRQWKNNIRNNCNPSGLFLLLLKWLLLRKTANKCATQSSHVHMWYANRIDHDTKII